MNNNTFTYFATKTRLKREMVICFYFLYFNYNFSVLQSRDLPRDWLLGEGGGRQGVSGQRTGEKELEKTVWGLVFRLYNVLRLLIYFI